MKRPRSRQASGSPYAFVRPYNPATASVRRRRQLRRRDVLKCCAHGCPYGAARAHGPLGRRRAVKKLRRWYLHSGNSRQSTYGQLLRPRQCSPTPSPRPPSSFPKRSATNLKRVACGGTKPAVSPGRAERNEPRHVNNCGGITKFASPNFEAQPPLHPLAPSPHLAVAPLRTGAPPCALSCQRWAEVAPTRGGATWWALAQIKEELVVLASACGVPQRCALPHLSGRKPGCGCRAGDNSRITLQY
eukprot:364950-Chlamydomonas_euryale.AAC.12